MAAWLSPSPSQAAPDRRSGRDGVARRRIGDDALEAIWHEPAIHMGEGVPLDGHAKCIGEWGMANIRVVGADIDAQCARKADRILDAVAGDAGGIDVCVTVTCDPRCRVYPDAPGGFKDVV